VGTFSSLLKGGDTVGKRNDDGDFGDFGGLKINGPI
jgi:hypothetical protein